MLFVITLSIHPDSFNSLSVEAQIVLATTVWMAIWWITEAIPIYVTALLPLVIFPSLYVTDIGQTSANYSGEIISNTATAALLIPISASLATVLDVNPLLLMIPITIATAYGFIMPVGTPPNAIVFASGRVTAKEMARAGFPLDIIGIIIVVIFGTTFVPTVWN